MKTYKSFLLLCIFLFFVFRVEAQLGVKSHEDINFGKTSISSKSESPAIVLRDTSSSINSENSPENVRPRLSDSLKKPPSSPDETTFYCGPNSICGPSNPAPGVPIPEIPEPAKKNPKKSENNSGIDFDSDLGHSPKQDFSFSYVVALLSNGNVKCSGVLLGKNKILTAAHCLCDRRLDKMFLGTSIYTGDISNVGFTHTAELSNEVEFFNEDFCEQHKGNDNAIVSKNLIDLGIISTLRDIDLPDKYFFQPTNLSQSQKDTKQFLIVGFGASNNTNAGGVKRYVKINANVCDSSNKSIGGCIEGLEIVAINDKGDSVDTCKGDSGGPLITMDQTEVLKLTGLTSRKISGGKENYCGSGGVYINLTAPIIQNWLNNRLKIIWNKG